MSQGYRLNGGVIGFKHLWESDKTGVWDIKSPFVNNNIPPVPFGEYLYTSIGTHTFTVPTDVTIISVLVIGGGGGGMYWSGTSNASYRMNGGGGGGLTYKNNISVTPGDNYTVVVGAGGVEELTLQVVQGVLLAPFLVHLLIYKQRGVILEDTMLVFLVV